MIRRCYKKECKSITKAIDIYGVLSHTYAPASKSLTPRFPSSIDPVVCLFVPMISIKTLASVPARSSAAVVTLILYSENGKCEKIKVTRH